MRAIVALFALFCLLSAVPPASAEEIPQEVLDNDYKLCMQDCSAKGGSEERCKTFCSCMNEGTKAKFTYEEYQKLASDLAAGQLADKASVDKLKSTAAQCSQPASAATPAPTP
jgi:hypothetical protein